MMSGRLQLVLKCLVLVILGGVVFSQAYAEEKKFVYDDHGNREDLYIRDGSYENRSGCGCGGA